MQLRKDIINQIKYVKYIKRIKERNKELFKYFKPIDNAKHEFKYCFENPNFLNNCEPCRLCQSEIRNKKCFECCGINPLNTFINLFLNGTNEDYKIFFKDKVLTQFMETQKEKQELLIIKNELIDEINKKLHSLKLCELRSFYSKLNSI